MTKHVYTAEAVSALSRVGMRSFLNQVSLGIHDFESVNLSFSVSGEDLALRKHLKDQLRSSASGFYVDIGSADPRFGSNSYLYYCYGWSGICIDVKSILAPAYAKSRPRDIFLNLAIGETKATAFYAPHKINQGMSMVRSHESEFGTDFGTPTVVQTVPLRDVLDKHMPKGCVIDFMSIDIEGSEMGALRSNDWTRYRPKFIIIETLEIDVSQPMTYPTVRFLCDQNYQLIGIIGDNVLMRRCSE